MKAIFLDRDGTVTVGIPKYERVDSLDKVELLPNTLKACRVLASLDYGVFFISNQAGIAEGLITLEDFNAINNKAIGLLAPSGIKIIDTYICPHGEDSDCECRKPKPKLILDAANDYGIDLKESYMIGDRRSDIEAGINAGTKTILVETGRKPSVPPECNYTAVDLLEAARYIANQG
jgi:histidinol-phosphate phosphatase family protein